MLARHDGLTIVNLDKLTYAGNRQSLADVEEAYGDSRYQFVRGDIANGELVAHLLTAQKLDAVVNFAAESHVDRSITDAGPFVATNVVGTQSLLDAARRCKIRRFVQVSTDEVYGTLGPDGKFREDTPLAPNSPYSASKAAGDLLVRAAHETYGLETVITRCSNNYGPYQFPEKLIPLMDVCIVNISRGGARLRYDPEVGQTPFIGERLLFNAQLQPFGELSRYRPSTVRWCKNAEFGLAFDHPLSLSVPDIMPTSKPSSRASRRAISKASASSTGTMASKACLSNIPGG